MISVLTGSPARETLWATDTTAELLEDLQFTLNEGACMEAAGSGHPVLVADVHHSSDAARWPMFAAAVADQTSVGALFALPLQWGSINLGVLEMYRVAPGLLSNVQLRDVLAVADTAALMLLGRRTEARGHGALGHDRGAEGWGAEGGVDLGFGHRAEIHQATGMVLVQLGLGVTDALVRLRGYAFVHRRLLREVAREVVERRLVFAERR